MKSTKKALFTSALSLLLCVSMLVGTTFAWFTDSVTSGVNQIIAGNLDVEVKHTNATVTDQTVAGATDLFTDKDGNAMLWEPGAVAYETFTVSNVGTLAFKYNMSLNIADYNAVNEHTLMEVLKVKVLEGSEIQSTVTRDSVAGLDWNTTDTLDVFRKNGCELYPAANTDGEASEEQFQVIVYWQPTDSDNNWNVNNGKTTTDGEPLFIKFGISVVATQLAYESDSFDENYDQSIVLPDLPVSIHKTFQSAPIVNAATEIVTVKNVSTNTGVATMPVAAANAVIDALTAQATDKQPETDVSTVIFLKVETDATKTNETSVTYNIDFSAIMTYTDTNGETKTTELQNLDGNMGDQIVTATMNIGKGLSNVNVDHDGTSMNALTSATTNAEGYFYNKTVGELTIKSKSFSPFTVNYDFEGVAMIGETVYTSMEEALAAADNGDTIVLMKNITLTKQMNLTKNLTVDLNGKTLNGDAIKYPVKINKNTEVVFTDSVGTGLFTQTYTSTGVDMFEIYGKLTINGGYYYTNGTYGIFYRYSGCDLTINDGVFINAKKIVGGSSGTVQYNGGYYSIPVECPEGYTMKQTTLNGNTYYVMVAVTAEDAVATITRGENIVNFATLADAIKAASGTDTVVVVKNATLAEGYTFSKALFIDLNGHTVTPSLESCETAKYYVEMDGDICSVKAVGKWSANAAEMYATPIENKVVTIASAAELALFAKQINSGSIGTGCTVKLVNDIDLKKNTWDEPIGKNHRFVGVFDGQGHTISNMKATTTPSYGNGLFADMDSTSVIKNFTIENASVGSGSGNNIYGIVSGYAYGTVTFENITVKNSYVGGYGKIGGILGMAADPSGTTIMKNCVVEDTVIAGAYNCGGLIGLAQNGVELSDCSTNNVTWSKGSSNSSYMYVDEQFTNGSQEFSVNGTYWKYKYGGVTYLYAAWGDYYTDLYAGDYKATINDVQYVLADGGCHNK